LTEIGNVYIIKHKYFKEIWSINMNNQKIIFITGGTQGIGKAIVEELVKENGKIIAGYNKSEEKAKQIKQEIYEKYHKEVDFIQGDLSKEEDIEKIIQYIDEKYGKVDILINNAGIAIDTTVEDKRVEDFRKILDVNLIAPFILSRHYGKKMYENRFGKIINIASTNGIDTIYPESLDYDASKAGLISLTKNIVMYYAPYVQVNAIAPGWVNTEMNVLLSDEFKKEECDKILMDRFAEPEEIAKVVKFLASDEASYINGTVIRVDGGCK